MEDNRTWRQEESRTEETKGGGSTIADFDYQKYAETEEKATHTDAVVALVVGILSIVLSFVSGFFGLIAGIIGIVYGRKGRRDTQRPGMGLAGFICAIIGTVLSALGIIMTILLIGFIASV